MSNFQNVTKLQDEHKVELHKRFGKRGALAVVVASAYLAMASANAAGVSDLFTTISTEMGGVSTGVLSILTILAGVVALLLGWAYVKRAK